MKAITNGKFILPDENGNFFVSRSKFLTFDEKILNIGDTTDATEIIDAENNFVAPGFINIHIHGCAGCDTMDATPDALDKICEFLPACGVTSFLPTTMTMTLEKIFAALKNIRQQMSHSKREKSRAKVLGANVEGPFINENFCGAQDKKNIIPANFEIFADFADVIKIITFAPEKLDSENFINTCREKNIIPSIGHSAATYEQAMTAIQQGATHITHLFNAQTGLHHRKPGIVGAAFDSHANVELITDDVHVSPTAQRVVYKCKPRAEIILITDSIRACGFGEGESELGGQKVFVKGNVATLADGRLAASVAKMNDVVKIFRDNTGASVAEVVELVTKNPARELKMYDRIGSLEVGKAADIVIFDDDFNIKKTFTDGR